jgi:hypothetical protein
MSREALCRTCRDAFRMLHTDCTQTMRDDAIVCSASITACKPIWCLQGQSLLSAGAKQYAPLVLLSAVPAAPLPALPWPASLAAASACARSAPRPALLPWRLLLASQPLRKPLLPSQQQPAVNRARRDSINNMCQSVFKLQQGVVTHNLIQLHHPSNAASTSHVSSTPYQHQHSGGSECTGDCCHPASETPSNHTNASTAVVYA